MRLHDSESLLGDVNLDSIAVIAAYTVIASLVFYIQDFPCKATPIILV